MESIIQCSLRFELDKLCKKRNCLLLSNQRIYSWKMKKKLQYFRGVQRGYANAGISRYKPRLNLTTAIAISDEIIVIILEILFIIFNAKTFLEYTKCIYLTSLVIACCTVFTGLLIKKEKLCELIKNYDGFVVRSKWNYTQISLALIISSLKWQTILTFTFQNRRIQS